MMEKQKTRKMAPMGMVYVITDCTGCRQGRQSGYVSISSAQGVATRMESKLWAIYDARKDANMWGVDDRAVYKIDLVPVAE